MSNNLTDMLNEAKKMAQTPEQTKSDIRTPNDGSSFDLARITEILDHPMQGKMFQDKFNMDISGAKSGDGVVSKNEAVELLSGFAEKLITKGYISSDVDAGLKTQNETLLRQDLGADVASYDNLTATQKDAFLTFISVPETERQSAIQKALVNGLTSLDKPDGFNDGSNNPLFLNLKTGALIDLNDMPNPITHTQSHTEVPTTPLAFKIDVADFG